MNCTRTTPVGSEGSVKIFHTAYPSVVCCSGRFFVFNLKMSATPEASLMHFFFCKCFDTHTPFQGRRECIRKELSDAALVILDISVGASVAVENLEC